MTHPAKRLADARNVRNEARATFDARLSELKGDLDTRSVGGRIADKLGADARDTFDSVLDVANESKLAIAGTAAALTIWFLRNPIMTLVEYLLLQQKERKE